MDSPMNVQTIRYHVVTGAITIRGINKHDNLYIPEALLPGFFAAVYKLEASLLPRRDESIDYPFA